MSDLLNSMVILDHNFNCRTILVSLTEGSWNIIIIIIKKKIPIRLSWNQGHGSLKKKKKDSNKVVLGSRTWKFENFTMHSLYKGLLNSQLNYKVSQMCKTGFPVSAQCQAHKISSKWLNSWRVEFPDLSTFHDLITLDFKM